MEPMIFSELVHPPDPHALVRERLEARLLGPTSPRLGLVLGPPGSGKTTLLSRIAAIAPTRTAWYRANGDDQDEASLVRHLGYALGTALADPAIVAAATQGRTAALLSSLEQDPGRTVQLIVDDLHEIAGSDAEASLERFLALRPRRVRILLGSRRPPQMNTSRLLVSGELCQLDGDDLRFRSWEVEELFRTFYESPLSPETAAALTRRTGGWAAGLQLFHLATAGMARLERERAVDELSGRSRLIRSYLARNVLGGLDEARRSFFLRTCTLGKLTGELCDALLDTTGSASVLDELERQHFFTTSTDGGLTFHYHPVLQTHLEVVLADELGARAARQLYSRSALLLEQAGMAGEALRAHVRAEDWGAVARLQQEASLTGQQDARRLRDGLRPEGDRWGDVGLLGTPSDDPGLVLASARRALRTGRLEEAVARYREAEALMDDPDFRARCADERAAASVWLPTAPGLDPGRQPAGDPNLQLARELRRATQSVRSPEEATIGLARGVCYLLAGDSTEATRQLWLAPTGPDLAEWEGLAIRLAGQLTDLVSRPEEAAAGQLEEIVLSADLAGLPWLARLARGLQAALLVAVRPTPSRRDACADLLQDCEHRADRWSLCLLNLVLGAAHLLAGADDLAERPLQRAEEVAAALDAPVLQVWAAALRLVATTEEHRPVPGPEGELVGRWARALGVEGAAEMLQRGRPRRPLHPTAAIPTTERTGSATTSEAAPSPPGTVPAAAVQLRTLGGFSLRVHGVEVDWVQLRPRARSLLMLLALHCGRDVHRERLIDAVWPEANLTSGTRSLQVAVSSVRSCLAPAGLPEVLQRHGDAYALHLPDAADQLQEFERLAQAASGLHSGHDLRRALECRMSALTHYEGDLLPEVGPAEWVVQDRDRLRALAADVAADAARSALTLGDLETGVRAARRSLELDPYHDLSWALLGELYNRLGDHTAAAVTRQRHAQVCADLGLPLVVAVPDPTAAARPLIGQRL